MADFNNTWRKRLACERCRHLKVRCEYSSPTNDTCVRCQKSNTPCIIPTPKRKDGRPGTENGFVNGSKTSGDGDGMVECYSGDVTEDNKEEHAVYLRRIIRDAEQKLGDMGVSPLRQAIHAGVYTIEEAGQYYRDLQAIACAFPAISLLDLPNDIMELDKTWPWLSIAIVTSMSMNSSGKSVTDIQLFVQDLYKSGLDNQPFEVSLDRQIAFALMLQYAMSFRDRGMTALLQFQSLTIATIKHLHRIREYKQEEIALHVAAATILPYTVLKSFSASTQMAYFYNSVMRDFREPVSMLPDIHMTCECTEGTQTLETTQVLAAGPLMETILTYHRAASDLAAASTLDDVNRIIDVAIQSMDLLTNHTLVINVEFAKRYGIDQVVSSTSIPNSENLVLSPLRGTYLVAKMNLLKQAATRILDLRVCSEPVQCAELMRSIITQTAEHGGQLFRAFAHINSTRPYVRTITFHNVADALLIMQMMRYTAFACGVDTDVRADCLLEVVAMKWEELLGSSILVRQLYMLLFQPLEMSYVKIGMYDAKTKTVVGSGTMPSFNIIYYDGRTRQIRDTKPMTRDELLDLINEESHKRDIGGKNPDWFELTSTPSLSTVIHLLLFRL